MTRNRGGDAGVEAGGGPRGRRFPASIEQTMMRA